MYRRLIYYTTYKVISYNLRIIQNTLKPTCKPFWFLRKSIQHAISFILQKLILNRKCEVKGFFDKISNFEYKM